MIKALNSMDTCSAAYQDCQDNTINATARGHTKDATCTTGGRHVFPNNEAPPTGRIFTHRLVRGLVTPHKTVKLMKVRKFHLDHTTQMVTSANNQWWRVTRPLHTTQGTVR